HSEATGVAARHLDEGARERLHGTASSLEGVHAEFLNGGADVGGAGGRRQSVAKADAHRIRDVPRKFPQETPAGEAEDGTPEAVDVDRDDGDIDAFDDAFKAAAEGKQLADTGDFPFREDADNFAVAQGFGGLAERVDHFARALVG